MKGIFAIIKLCALIAVTAWLLNWWSAGFPGVMP